MNDAPAKKTGDALKLSASWTPDHMAADVIVAKVFGDRSPLTITSGRIQISAAIGCSLADPASIARASERANELVKELAANGIVHGHTVSAGRAPVDLIETLPVEQKDTDE